MSNLFRNTEQPYKMVEMTKLIPTVIDQLNVELKKNILKNGMKHPLQVRKSNNLLMVGNQRYRILKELCVDTVPVRYVK